MKMKARYYKFIKGNHYYQRAVPADLMQHYQRKVIQTPLNGTLEDIERQLNELGQKPPTRNPEDPTELNYDTRFILQSVFVTLGGCLLLLVMFSLYVLGK